MKYGSQSLSWVFAAIVGLSAGSAGAVDIHDTKMLTQPAISQDRIAFVYADDLWVADRDGSHSRRLTSDAGVEASPAFSPDGRWIAFSAQYDGNTDVFIVSSEGGVPRRLTYHPSADSALGFTPDGSRVLFASSRNVFTNRHRQFFTVSVGGGYPEALPIPHGTKAAYSPDGRFLAYTPLYEAFREWKHYRGGTASRIWIFKFSDYSVVQIPQPDGRCNDTDPMWIADRVYFRSDRDGEFNLYAYDPKSRQVQRLTRHEDFPILEAGAGAGQIIYEQAARLHVYNPRNKKSETLHVGVAADLIGLRPRYVSGNNYIRNADISPSGARAVFEFRGEIVTVPAEKGDARNLTQTTGVHERSPVWSPDGKWVAYFSDASGEYKLRLEPQDGKGETREIAVQGAGFYDRPVWAPDSKKLSYTDNSFSLYWVDLDTDKSQKVASEYQYGPIKTMTHSWSPDSKWLTYTLNTNGLMETVYLYSIEEGQSHQVTDGLSDVSEPVFDANGKYLYFLASTDAGPIKDWFAMSNNDMQVTRSVHMAVLYAGEPSPLVKESDEEVIADSKDSGKKEAAEGASGDGDADKPAPAIDFEHLSQRIIPLPVPADNYRNLQVGESGEIYFLKAQPGQGFRGFGPGEIQHFSLKTRKVEPVVDGVGGFILSADNKKVLYNSRGSWFIASLKGKVQSGQGRLDTSRIQVKIDPVAEWKQIYNEAWRINRDYFYATNYHGVDWEAERDKYAVFLPDLAVRSDLNRVIQWLMSELSVGHHRVGGGDSIRETDRIPGGLLGADYEIADGRYRFKKVYGGLNWNPQLRSPLTVPGVDVRAGEYLLAVQGIDLRPPTNLFQLFENTAGKLIDITVGPNPDGTDSRTVSVEPVANESSLRNRDWVEGNLRKVDEATGGRVAYVYVPNTSTAGHTYFKRYFFPQVHKDAIIVDERFNGGGQVADYYIDLLRRPFIAHWAMRYGADLDTPNASIQGPKVMLIDETAGSGGDLLPWMFHKFQVGTLVGRRTWGGLVGILGFPVLMDGATVTAPNLAIWTDENGWVVENQGVPPDIEVEQWPADVIAGHDPQLEKAIEVALEELKKHPPKESKRPPFPVRNH